MEKCFHFSASAELYWFRRTIIIFDVVIQFCSSNPLFFMHPNMEQMVCSAFMEIARLYLPSMSRLWYISLSGQADCSDAVISKMDMIRWSLSNADTDTLGTAKTILKKGGVLISGEGGGLIAYRLRRCQYPLWGIPLYTLCSQTSWKMTPYPLMM